ncbi:hypothetical protein OPV22_020484 [Ensete ventricosum]|uniref:Uncharacterized protein n=1 Tax=Ensete ventricosum TaxID=4639 RepID=A0AAV8QEW8_ENSVE|nr:hypothetical protein OPV22_020484 [Ensete ventricosum]
MLLPCFKLACIPKGRRKAAYMMLATQTFSLTLGHNLGRTMSLTGYQSGASCVCCAIDLCAFYISIMLPEATLECCSSGDCADGYEHTVNITFTTLVDEDEEERSLQIYMQVLITKNRVEDSCPSRMLSLPLHVYDPQVNTAIFSTKSIKLLYL